MKYPTYKEIVPVGTVLLIAASSFGLGVVYSNLIYDYQTLWAFKGDTKVFQNSFNHYLNWASAPAYLHYILHFVMFLGILGGLIKLYKPSEDTTYFEYGTLGLFVLSIIVYLTNLRTGINSVFFNSWGEVSMETGINVIAASQFFVVVLLFGVIFLQGGLYFAEWYDGQLKEEFFANEKKELEAKEKAESITTGAEKTKEKESKVVKKKSKKA
ncbi:secretory component protein Shr3p [[Candida] jaroonii]|uniref:Secretory component protein Shr3p n=1 Tax=[Candida] jaroonii TaxID=467808 RepID=A0ACA9YFF3_9ASCO|nr:secretory component protein Shr3p [[Candida] jaroonii]